MKWPCFRGPDIGDICSTPIQCLDSISCMMPVHTYVYSLSNWQPLPSAWQSLVQMYYISYLVHDDHKYRCTENLQNQRKAKTVTEHAHMWTAHAHSAFRFAEFASSLQTAVSLPQGSVVGWLPHFRWGFLVKWYIRYIALYRVPSLGKLHLIQGLILTTVFCLGWQQKWSLSHYYNMHCTRKSIQPENTLENFT